MQTRHHDVDKDILIIEATEAINDDQTETVIDELESEILAGRHSRIIVDCAGVGFLSSFGLSLLIRLRNAAQRSRGDMKLAALSPVIYEILRVSKMAPHFMVYPDVEQARIAFHRKSI